MVNISASIMFMIFFRLFVLRLIFFSLVDLTCDLIFVRYDVANFLSYRHLETSDPVIFT